MIKIMNERLGVPDYYGLYIEPWDGEAFIIYNQDQNRIQQLSKSLKREWTFLRKDSTEAIKEYINEELTWPTDFNEIIDEPDIDYDLFTKSTGGSIYQLGNQQIQIIRSFG